MRITVDGFEPDGPIPETFAFCAMEGMGANRNPRVAWSDAPAGTRSFAVLCIDPDAPTDATNVNKEGVTVPADLPRTDFAHWVLVDIGGDVSEIAEGADSDGVTQGGKPTGATALGGRGRNDYTAWFDGNADMGGTYGGYDGPCPPANDEIVHHYVFTVYALDIDTLGLSGDFGAADVLSAIEGHVLDSASVTGTYTLNPALR
ncbi:MAG: YbhB/YbcL family Raf kinase inhibitor-like protein [Acidimicrobiia bacterium]|nr:YbhB/YbcL family Raf kinase inhibitor-like protein [Acidimicrobiia bacterium]